MPFTISEKQRGVRLTLKSRLRHYVINQYFLYLVFVYVYVDLTFILFCSRICQIIFREGVVASNSRMSKLEKHTSSKKKRNWSELKINQEVVIGIVWLAYHGIHFITGYYIKFYSCAMHFIKNYLKVFPSSTQMFLISMMTKITLMKCFNCSGSRLMW